MRATLAEVVYRCDLENMYTGNQAFAKDNQKAKQVLTAKEAKLLDRRCLLDQGPLDFERVIRMAMQQHLLSRHDFDAFVCYSAPCACLAVEAIDVALAEPASKRRRTCDDSGDAAVPTVADVEEQAGAAPPDIVIFHIILKNPSEKKVMRTAVGSGGKLAKGAAIAFHSNLSSDSPLDLDTMLISGTPSEMDVQGQFLLNSFSGSLEDLKVNVLKWRSAKLVWTLRGCLSLGFAHGELDVLLHGVVAAGAFHRNTESLGYTALLEQMQILKLLERHGFACSRSRTDIRWFLTDKGVKELNTIMQVSSPVQVFLPRDRLALEDRTAYELAEALREAGWEWRLWLQPSKRTRRMALGHDFAEFARGGAKIWYSGQGFCMPYMLLLLQAEAFFDRGLPSIVHGAEEVRYKRILKGDIQGEIELRKALPADVENAGGAGSTVDEHGGSGGQAVGPNSPGDAFGEADDLAPSAESELEAALDMPEEGLDGMGAGNSGQRAGDDDGDAALEEVRGPPPLLMPPAAAAAAPSAACSGGSIADFSSGGARIRAYATWEVGHLQTHF